MSNSFRLSLLFVYIIFNNINDIRTIPQGYLLGATFKLGTTSNKLYKIDPITGVFTLFTSLDGYNPDDATYDLINKIFYIFVSGPAVRRESSMSLILVNPFNGTKQYRNIITEDYAELYGLRVDSSTGKLYSLQMSSAGEDPVSIVQIDPFNFIATRWVNITEVSGISPDSMAIFYNATNHQYFVTVVSGDNETLV
ncbi:unnamed protein product, partial [Adineta steineri]